MTAYFWPISLLLVHLTSQIFLGLPKIYKHYITVFWCSFLSVYGCAHLLLFIGTYFWEHIFEGTLQKQSQAWSFGEVDLENIVLRFL